MALQSDIIQTVETRRSFRIELNRERLLAMLRCELDIPSDAHIIFSVPGGADWSNTNIDIDDAHPVVVSWSTVERTR
jgi:hypothetical protein